MSNLTLSKHAKFEPIRGPVVLVVLDGVGLGDADDGNAVWLARTPNLDLLARAGLSTHLKAHGTAVGLPSDEDMGNSEVGHNAMGAGRVFDQGAKLVNDAIATERLFHAAAWRELVANVKKTGEPMHFIGLLSDGNVHSHIDHLRALLSRADAEAIERVRVHVLLDGRDVPKTSALIYVDTLEAHLAALTTKPRRDYRIASGGGRMTITMDRYNADWPMVARGWSTHVRGEGRRFASARAAIEAFRQEAPDAIDQFLPPFVVADEEGAPIGPIRDGASVVFFNFRGDRAIEISRAFEEEAFSAFDRGPRPDVTYAGMLQYDGDLKIPKRFLVSPPTIDRTVSEYLARMGVPQLAISETQKFGHVTYFWNGNRSGKFDERVETYIEVPSDVRPFDERPWMKAAEITDALLDALEKGSYRHARVNFANGDMVGHTGVPQATVLAVEAVDLQLGRILRRVEALGGALIVTADHGNADECYERDRRSRAFALDEHGARRTKTSHTLNPVPFYLYAPGRSLRLRDDLVEPGLANVAATLLELLGFAAPEGYEPSLLG